MAGRRGRRIPVTDDQLNYLAAMWKETRSEKYRRPQMAYWEVIRVAEANGKIPPGVLSDKYLARWIRASAIDPESLETPTIHRSIIAPQAGALYQADISWCRQVYLRDNGQVELGSIRKGTMAYQNRDLPPERKVLRFLLTDVASGCYFPHYLPAERTEDLVVFLHRALGPKWPLDSVEWRAYYTDDGFDHLLDEDRERIRRGDPRFPFAGIPKRISFDRGAAQRAGAVKGINEFAGVIERLTGHPPVFAQHPRSNGSVESHHYKWEQWFESKLSLRPAASLDQLNAWAWEQAAWHQRHRPHTRHTLSRFEAFLSSAPAELRVPPPWLRFRAAVVEPPKAVHAQNGYLRLTRGGQLRVYVLTDPAYRFQWVGVSPHLFDPGQIDVSYPAPGRACAPGLAPKRWRLKPASMHLGTVVLTAEERDALAETPTMRMLERVKAVDLSGIDPFKVVETPLDRTTLIPRRAVEASLDLRQEQEPAHLTRRVFNDRVKVEAGPFTDAMAAGRERLFAGRATVTEQELEQFLAWCRTPAAHAPALRAVEGGAS